MSLSAEKLSVPLDPIRLESEWKFRERLGFCASAGHLILFAKKSIRRCLTTHRTHEGRTVGLGNSVGSIQFSVSNLGYPRAILV
jgi:hypothetical protein